MHLLPAVVIALVGVGSDSGEGGSKVGGSAGESSRQDTKNGKEPIHWHSKCVTSLSLLIQCLYFIHEQGYRDKHIQVWELTVGGYNNGVYTAFYSTNMNNRWGQMFAFLFILPCVRHVSTQVQRSLAYSCLR